MRDSEIERQLLLSCLEDWEPATRLIWLARVEAGDEGFREAAMRVLQSLLERGLIELGEIGDTGFEAYPGSANSLLELARTTLERTDWQPGLGEFWIATTPLGDEVARALGVGDLDPPNQDA